MVRDMGRTFRHLETKVVRAGQPSPRIEGAVVTPIFQSATFEYAGELSYHALRYARLNNTPQTRMGRIEASGRKGFPYANC